MLRRAIILFTPFIRRSLLTGGPFLDRPFQVTRADPAVNRLALIVRGADTDSFDLAPQAAGLWAISAGLSYNYKDDHEQLSIGMKSTMPSTAGQNTRTTRNIPGPKRYERCHEPRIHLKRPDHLLPQIGHLGFRRTRSPRRLYAPRFGRQQYLDQ